MCWPCCPAKSQSKIQTGEVGEARAEMIWEGKVEILQTDCGGNAGMRSQGEGSRRKEGERKAISRRIKRNKQKKQPAWKTREEETGRAHSLKISKAGSETDSEAETNLRPKKILKGNQCESRKKDKLSQQIHLAS